MAGIHDYVVNEEKWQKAKAKEKATKCPKCPHCGSMDTGRHLASNPFDVSHYECYACNYEWGHEEKVR
jgi:transposase-like protein